MAIDKAALRESAKKHYIAKARDEIEGLIKCWPQNIKYYLKALNDIVKAGREMGVTDADARTFSPDEIFELVADLSPLAELEMRDEIRDILVPKLREKGFDEEVMSGLVVEAAGS